MLYLLTIRYWLFEFLGPYYSVLIITIKFLTFIVALDILNDLLKYFYRKRMELASKQHDNITLGLNNIYLLLVLSSSIVTITAYFGLNPRELFTSLSIVAAALAIISRDYIVDIISGMFIAFSKEVVIDDLIKIGDHTGKIVDIGINKTALLNDDDDLVYVPNHKFIMNDIINYSKSPVRKTIIDFELNYANFKTIDDLELALSQSMEEFKPYIEFDSFKLKIIHIYKDAVHLKVQYAMNITDRAKTKEIRKRTIRRILAFVNEHSVDQSPR
ncbi:MAG: mechanosensitive ion channel [Saprospiraceae bacterium]|nr:mechanosensitive ion channel [Saprospiraceae bacterium]